MPSGTPPPSIAGLWRCRRNLSFVIQIFQNGNYITSDFDTVAENTNRFHHHIGGQWDVAGGKFAITMSRTNETTPCTTIIHGVIELTTPTVMHTKMVDSDGACDLSLGFHEDTDWDRVSATKVSDGSLFAEANSDASVAAVTNEETATPEQGGSA